MDLDRERFAVEYRGKSVTGHTERAAGTYRGEYLAREAAVSGDGNAINLIRLDELDSCLIDIGTDDGPVTWKGAPLPPKGDPNRRAWIDMLPIEIVTAIVFARLGIARAAGNSEPTPEG